MSHMDIINQVTSDVGYGFGKRLIAIPADLMADAPASLLAITKEMTGRDIHNDNSDAFQALVKQQRVFKSQTYKVFAYQDSEEEMNHENALVFANKLGMRLLDKEEAEWFSGKFEKLTMWKKSLLSIWYWTASVDSNTRYIAWLFIGYYGNVSSSNRFDLNGVRCVGGP